MKKVITSEKAFSLVELLLVIAIIGIMSAVTIVSMQGSKTDKEVEAAALEVVATIRSLQNDALTGRNPDQLKTICEYDFNISGGSNYKTSYHYKDQAGNCNVIIDNPTTLKNGVIFGVVNGVNTNNITFSLPHAGVSYQHNKILLRKNSFFYSICLDTSSGKIEARKGDVSC